jgi:hypothetical protein
MGTVMEPTAITDDPQSYVDAAIAALTWVKDQIPYPIWWVMLGGGIAFVFYKFAQLYFGRAK